MEAEHSKVRIYTSHHKPSAFLSCSIIKPIHVGKANSYNDICCPGDDTGINISFKNPYYCELTAQYWVWKNAEPTEYVGFMHYRRHLNFSQNQIFDEDNWGVVNDDVISKEYEDKFGLNERDILSALNDCDVLLPKKWSVKRANSKNNLEHYKVSEHLYISDYLKAINILLQLYPEYRKAVELFNDSDEGYYTNMFLMKWELFDEYSSWLFNVLENFENDFSMRNYNTQEKRVIGHISERLFNIFIIQKQNKGSLKIRELQRTFVRNETFNAHLKPKFNKSAIPVIICFDDNYSLSAGALLNSIIKNSTSNNYYDVVVLENNVSEENKMRFSRLVNGLANFSLRFFDVNAFSEIKGAYTRAHFSAATYARLFIPRIFSNYDKVLFIDADTIVESDVAELLSIDIGTNLIAAVKDIVMEGFVKFGAITHVEGGDKGKTAGEYLVENLGMENTEKYFQAGIIVFNVNQINVEGIGPQLISEINGRKYWFLDQDIMNKVFYGRVHFLPLEWNVYHGNGNTNEFFPNLKFSTYMNFLSARKKPKMIHFAGENKPWDTTRVDFSDNFNFYVNGTPWQRELFDRLKGMPKYKDENKNKAALQTRIKRKVMPFLNKWAPIGSKRRQFLSRNYYKFRKLILG